MQTSTVCLIKFCLFKRVHALCTCICLCVFVCACAVDMIECLIWYIPLHVYEGADSIRLLYCVQTMHMLPIQTTDLFHWCGEASFELFSACIDTVLNFLTA